MVTLDDGVGGVALLVDVQAARIAAAAIWRIRDRTHERCDLFRDVTHAAMVSRRNKGCPPDLVMAVWPRRHEGDGHTSRAVGTVRVEDEGLMWNQIDRVVKAVSNVTVGTVIVLVHVVLHDRQTMKSLRESSLRNQPRRLPS